MFYDGDLQSGIAHALQETKSVACFLTDNGSESRRWQESYLTDEQIGIALRSRAITLRIESGSQEAGFLAAYYPVPQVPAFIVILNGQLLLDLRAGEAPHTFKAAVLKTLSMTPEPASASTSVPDPIPATPPSHPVSATPSSLPNIDIDSAERQENASPATGAVESNSNPSAVARLLAERKTRLEKDKQAKDKAEKEDRKAKAEARTQSLAQDPTSTKGKQASYALQERKRQKEARLERERIKQQIEHDKAERREKEERRKAQAKAEAESREAGIADGDSSIATDNRAQPFVSSSKPRSSTCAIQIRLFDGSNIRSKFPSDQSLRSHVRKWIDESREDGDAPYTLKQILTPLPNRTLSISEEEQTLQDLGLVPSCTLVMVPVQEYTAAYTNSQGLLSKGASAGYNIVASGAGLVVGALGTFLGLGGVQAEAAGQSEPSPPEQARNPERRSQDTSSRINVRTLRDQQSDRDPHQLYNGNQLNFEPRRDDDEKRD